MKVFLVSIEKVKILKREEEMETINFGMMKKAGSGLNGSVTPKKKPDPGQRIPLPRCQTLIA